MIRTEIISTMRQESPDITERVLSDVQCNTMLIQGNLDVCTKTRCIYDDFSFNSEVGISSYDLTSKIPKFYDIDEYPGGGVNYDDQRITKSTIAELDSDDPGWRNSSNGIPQKYFRRGKWLKFDIAPDEVKSIIISAIIIPDQFNDDNISPFNGLTYLEPFHYSLVLYLRWKGKINLGKQEDMVIAQREYLDYCKWIKQQLGGHTYGEIRQIPPHNL